MKISTQTIVLLGIIQCILLTLFLLFFWRYQQLHEDQAVVDPVIQTDAPSSK